ncbi:MAG: hypothetical protein NVS3B20_04470 [Polyangiales bacterium]
MMKRPRAIIASCTFALFAWWPSAAFACPVCGAGDNANTLKVAAAFMTVPFVISFLVIRALRRVQRDTP